MTTTDVLIPFFNDPAGFERSIHSVNHQDWSGNFRIVVVDDGSEQNAHARMRECLDQSGMSHYVVRNTSNRGRPFTRNVLLDLADSEYVAWLDSGDIWYPKKISLQIKAINTQLSNFTANLWATCSYDWKQSGLADREKIQDPGTDSMRALLEGRSFRAYLWTIVSRRQAMTNVGYFDENLPRLQDLDFFIRFILNGGDFVQPLARTPLCAYFKEHRGRDAEQIKICNEYIQQKYDHVYYRYGRKFQLDCELRAVKNSIRFAVANDQGRVANRYKQRVLVLKLKKLLTAWV